MFNALYFFAEKFAERGFDLYGVGSVVRNTFLELPISDIDICSAMKPDEVIGLCKDIGFSFSEIGTKYGTVGVNAVFGDEKFFFEHTTFRNDKYGMDGAHRPTEVAFSDDIKEDAFRRDFSVNAIYKNLLTGEIVDPTNGLPDLLNRVIRATTDDPSVILQDDGLRLMRLIRFSCELNFTIDKNTWRCALLNSSALFDISYERIRDEFNKILLSDVRYDIVHPESPVYRGLSLLSELDVIKYIAKELEWGRSMAQKPEYHAYTVLDHMFHTAAVTPPNLILRLAGLFHDLGKPIAYDMNDGKNMYGHDKIGAELVNKVLKRLKYSNTTVEAVTNLILSHMYDITGTAKETTLRRQIVKWGVEFTKNFAALRIADVKGSGVRTETDGTAVKVLSLLDKMQSEHVPFSYAELNCTGDDIMSWCQNSAGKRIGEIKEQLLLHCAEKPNDNTKDKLEKLARSM